MQVMDARAGYWDNVHTYFMGEIALKNSMKNTLGSALAAATLGSLAMPAMAYEQGNWLLRAGWAQVAPNEDSGELEANGVNATGKDVLEISSASALGISATYMFNSVLGLDLLAATPFEHDISAKGDLAAMGIGDIGTTRQLPPTLTLQYYPMGHSHAQSPWQPYIGAGLNFTWFYDETLDDSFKAATGAQDKDFSLSNSWGPAAMIGLDYVFSNNWIINASVMYAQISTEAEINNTALGDLKVDADVNPWVYRINVGYRFGAKSKAAPVAAAAAVAAPVAAAVAAPVGDSDGDGVNDDVDQCPNTIEGALINEQGCGVKLTGAHFKFDSNELNPDAETMLDEVATRMQQYPDVKLQVEGHTDASGDEAYNLDLSRQRAQVAVDYLTGKGIDASRFQVEGLGSSKPVADNATEEGRKANRRVVFKTR